MIKILFLLISLILISCAEETMFKEMASVGDKFEVETIDPIDLPQGNEEVDICVLTPNAPECYTFCELNPNTASCNNLPVADCSANPTLPACQTLCQKFPAHQDCIELSYCQKYPDSIECKAYCLAFPNDSDCSQTVDCHDTPNDPSCLLFCEMYPHDELCAVIENPVYETVVQEFSQNEDNNQVDILWVIDNSGSMADEQNAIAANFESFIDAFLTNSSDYKMGITTTDTDYLNHDGEFQGTVPVLDSTMSSDVIKTNFMKNVKVGVNGSGTERGLLAATMALDKNFASNSKNYNFLRQEAFLAVIIVSDENDSSPNAVQTYVDSIRAFKNNPSNLAIYSIIDPNPANTPYYYGPRYMEASNLTSGFYEDIHTAFSQSLLNIGSNIVELISSFKLTNVPIITSIEVKVNGIKVERDLVNGWSYDDVAISIKFNGASIPAAGANIEIKYKYIVE